MRPQLGSFPHQEHFTRVDLPTACAAAFASTAFRAPLTMTSTTLRDPLAVLDDLPGQGAHHLPERLAEEGELGVVGGEPLVPRPGRWPGR